MWTTLSVVSVIVLLIGAVAIFVNTSPQMGQPPKGSDLERIRKSGNYEGGSFINPMETSTGDIWAALKEMPKMLFDDSNNPHRPLPVAFVDEALRKADSATHLTWFGHSAFLLELQGQRILIDPMLGDVASPVPFGTKRFAYQRNIPLEQLRDIDVVVISHDHYDHLDYPSIIGLKNEIKHFITPLGVGSHLKSWGVPSEKITELDWWESVRMGGIDYTSAPSRHFSGRGLTDRDATQWASWILKARDQNIYFSGDSGYGPHFREIGEKYGPFDLAMMECGQYNKAWSNIHMMPEETVQAAMDVNAKVTLPIHWGAFRLAPHGWTESVERFTQAADKNELPYLLPEIGERFRLGNDFPKRTWWTQAL
ncbi:MBL fold metallo-hydrolase [Pseudozobellia thermophila]|uniref:L-ascorbate metabolism protein UlaG, beta-lactamase superfamily n=1 Tax=Pseudozobellia thermophila TaxID=192903 RepID=A0A1M6G7N3_9FLAO|nr:MBL fold metallo-hydrolase [Pseudozobellia thermophila]SHJ05995.1 L-ascorbate metabolism protein UlaG, beta-lactamase superfamily [Pseudozobellia thermophila]